MDQKLLLNPILDPKKRIEWFSMKNFKILTIVILVLFAKISIFAINEFGQNPKKNPTKKQMVTKPGNCCYLGVDHQNKVRINQICKNKSTTTFELEFLERSQVCTIIENVTLIDNHGRKYKPKGYSGISNCPDSLSVSSGDRFTWSFELLDASASSFSLSEVELEAASGMNAWQWRDVSIGHCHL
ncbi:hypothetical protein JWG41_11445 [Leptospira sp. 201903075]|uniref:hypothetical protein n=1 Tax=Leptospira chreensis TaxID=2810035 RepID=UPI001964BBC0|nr:hypothetical protein [Leptospira chreensis]MBM9591065.1 hypothetical protein [Leptospira chreensis]